MFMINDILPLLPLVREKLNGIWFTLCTSEKFTNGPKSLSLNKTTGKEHT